MEKLEEYRKKDEARLDALKALEKYVALIGPVQDDEEELQGYIDGLSIAIIALRNGSIEDK